MHVSQTTGLHSPVIPNFWSGLQGSSKAGQHLPALPADKSRARPSSLMKSPNRQYGWEERQDSGMESTVRVLTIASPGRSWSLSTPCSRVHDAKATRLKNTWLKRVGTFDTPTRLFSRNG